MDTSTSIKLYENTGKVFKRFALFFEPFFTEFGYECLTKKRFVDVTIHILIMSMFIMSLYYFYTVWIMSNGIKGLINDMIDGLSVLLSPFASLCTGMFSKKRYDKMLKKCEDEGYTWHEAQR